MFRLSDGNCRVSWYRFSLANLCVSTVTWTVLESQVRDDGIASAVVSYSTPEGALDALCQMLLINQSKEDSKRINPEQRKKAAQQIMREFLEELPN